MTDIRSFIQLLEQNKHKEIQRALNAMTVDEVQTNDESFIAVFTAGMLFLGSLTCFLILLWIVAMCFEIYNTKDLEETETVSDLFFAKYEQPPSYNSVIRLDDADLPSFYTAVNNVTSTIIPAIDCSKDMIVAPFSPLSQTTADSCYVTFLAAQTDRPGRPTTLELSQPIHLQISRPTNLQISLHTDDLCRLVKNICRVQAPSQHSSYPLKVIQSLQYFQYKILN